MFATLKRSRKFYDVEIVTRPHPILIIAECAKTRQPMQFDQTISSPRNREKESGPQDYIHIAIASCFFVFDISISNMKAMHPWQVVILKQLLIKFTQ